MKGKNASKSVSLLCSQAGWGSRRLNKLPLKDLRMKKKERSEEETGKIRRWKREDEVK